MSKSLGERIMSEQQCARRITNDDLVCKDCAFKLDDSKKLGNTSQCEIFELKPNEVLRGGSCDEHKKV